MNRNTRADDKDQDQTVPKESKLSGFQKFNKTKNSHDGQMNLFMYHHTNSIELSKYVRLNTVKKERKK